MIAEAEIRKRFVPFAAVFAAMYGTLRLVPISAWIGIPGRVFTSTEFFAPSLGIVLGPYAGSVAATVGTFLGIMLTGRMNFFGLDFLPVLMNALVLGFIMRGKWLVSVLLYSCVLGLFLIHPATLLLVSIPFAGAWIVVPYAWLHILVLLLLLSPLSRKSQEWLGSESVLKLASAAALLTLAGTTVQHLTGNLLFAAMATPLMGIMPEALQVTWRATFWVYPFERLIIVVGATAVTVAVAKALKAAGFSNHVDAEFVTRG